jgi:hypothetical protein
MLFRDRRDRAIASSGPQAPECNHFHVSHIGAQAPRRRTLSIHPRKRCVRSGVYCNCNNGCTSSIGAAVRLRFGCARVRLLRELTIGNTPPSRHHDDLEPTPNGGPGRPELGNGKSCAPSQALAERTKLIKLPISKPRRENPIQHQIERAGSWRFAHECGLRRYLPVA